MGKKLQGLTEGLMSFAKTVPLLLGATVGIWERPEGGDSPLTHLTRGEWTPALATLTANYTFWSQGKFDMKQGVGVKGLALGIIAHKVIGWIDG
jgi:hypothetical protein